MAKLEPPERFLGRLKGNHLDVHQEAARILLAKSSRPTDLHRLIVRLFGRHPVRIVTTNFDGHFDSVLGELGREIPVFPAPALPLGDRFEGLVYLHGSAQRSPQDCVLTDADFGRAYLLEGWARRFLVALFSRYTVAFIGYSHSDVVVSYLARAMPPERTRPRYAFTMEGERRDWGFLGIESISYPKSADRNKHHALVEGLESWTLRIERSLFEHGQKVRDLAAAPPPPEGEDSEFLVWALGEPALARTFTKHASDPKWLAWLDVRHLLDPLFTLSANLGELDHELEVWLARNFNGANAEKLFALIEQHGGQLHPGLCLRLVVFLCSPHRDAAATAVLGRWVSILTAQGIRSQRPESWQRLLAACVSLPDPETFLVLIDTLTGPPLRMAKRWAGLSEFMGDEREVDFGVDILDEDWSDLGEIWGEWRQRYLPALCWRVLPIIEGNLLAATRLLVACEGSGAELDFFAVQRRSVESGANVWKHTILDFLVDAARDLLADLMERSPLEAASLIERWYHTGSSPLRRLAISGVAKRPDLSGDQKLRWLLDRDLLYRHKDEVFGFLRASYSQASGPMRQEILARAESGPAGGSWDQEGPEVRVYARLELLEVLAQAVPGCPEVASAIDALRHDYPKLASFEPPARDSASEETPDPGHPVDLDVKTLTRNPPDSFLWQLAQSAPDRPDPRRMIEYQAALAKAVEAKPEWGIEVVRAMGRLDISDQEVFSKICFAWRQSTLTEDQWKAILALAEASSEPPEFLRACVHLLDPGGRPEGTGFPEALGERAEAVARNIWQHGLSALPLEELGDNDWFHQAINRPAGRLAKFWFLRLAAARQRGAEGWAGIPSGLRRDLERVLTDPSASGVYARIIFAYHLVYVATWDDEFARTRLYPWFDWERDVTTAIQCWHGFLWGRRWSPNLVKDLLPRIEGLFDRAKVLPERLRGVLGWHVAYLALVGLEEPMRGDWLLEVVRRLPEASLGQFANTVEISLGEYDLPSRESLWERWMRAYWERRVGGSPPAIAGWEGERMASWAPSMGRFFPEAVELVLRMDKACLAGCRDLLDQLVERGLVRDHPEPSARLVVRYLDALSGQRLPSKNLATMRNLLAAAQLPPVLRDQVQDAFFRANPDPEP